MTKSFLILLLACALANTTRAQRNKNFNIIANYYGGPEIVDSFNAQQFTHIVFCFCYLKENKLNIATARDTATIQKLVALKQKNPKLKVLLAFGGWGGCATCSDIFSIDSNRVAFAESVKGATKYFQTDGIDVDWEFPALESLPDQKYKPEDKQNFTLLIQQLRNVLGNSKEISFSAGGFKWTINNSFEWIPVMKLVNRVNLMSYDFLYASTGHNASLFSTTKQKTSADDLIKYLVQSGVPVNKITIGAAFYGKVFDSVSNINNGLYQKGVAGRAIAYKDLDQLLPEQNGYTRYWDDTAHAAYIYNASAQQFISFENKKAVEEKTNYAIKNHLNGIMFWQLSQDKFSDGLLEAIDETRKKK